MSFIERESPASQEELVEIKHFGVARAIKDLVNGGDPKEIFGEVEPVTVDDLHRFRFFDMPGPQKPVIVTLQAAQSLDVSHALEDEPLRVRPYGTHQAEEVVTDAVMGDLHGALKTSRLDLDKKIDLLSVNPEEEGIFSAVLSGMKGIVVGDPGEVSSAIGRRLRDNTETLEKSLYGFYTLLRAKYAEEFGTPQVGKLEQLASSSFGSVIGQQTGMDIWYLGEFRDVTGIIRGIENTDLNAFMLSDGEFPLVRLTRLAKAKIREGYPGVRLLHPRNRDVITTGCPAGVHLGGSHEGNNLSLQRNGLISTVNRRAFEYLLGQN